MKLHREADSIGHFNWCLNESHHQLPRRCGEKEEFEPADAVRYRERSAAERTNARLKDEFGARFIMVRDHVKVMCHLMFGLLALNVDQLLRLRR